jgi:hypothetical protein
MFLDPLGYAAFAVGFAVGYVNQRFHAGQRRLDRLAAVKLILADQDQVERSRTEAPPGIGRSVGVIAITAAVVLATNVVIWQLLPYFQARDSHGWDAGTILLEISREEFAGERPFLDLFGLSWLVGACIIAFCVASWPVERPVRQHNGPF